MRSMVEGVLYSPAEHPQPRENARQSFSQRPPPRGARILMVSLRHEGAVPDRPTLRRRERRLRAFAGNGGEAPGIEERAGTLGPLLPSSDLRFRP